MYFLGVLDHAGVAGIDAVHICENLAHVRFQGGRDGDGGEIGTAAAQRLDHSFFRNPLEAGADQDVAFQQVLVHQRWVNVVDAPPRVAAEGGDPGLRPREGHGFFPQFMQSHAEQGDGLLFAGGHQHVKFAFARGFR